MNNIFYYFLALFAGIVLSTQSGVNSQLRGVLGNPILSSLVSFTIGTAVLLLYVVIFQPDSFSALSNLQGMTWHKWTGGVIGAFFVSFVIILAPRIGAANMMGLIVAGQILIALVFDHYGLLGFTQHSINWIRVAGALMLIGGVFLILKN
jgi:transporter family-2 protein